MFGRRPPVRRVTPQMQEQADITLISNSASKTVEQRVVLRHEVYIKNLKDKIATLESKSTVTSEESKKDPEVDGLKEKCDALGDKVAKLEEVLNAPKEVEKDPAVDSLKEKCNAQSELLADYEKKLLGLVEYIKRLETGLDTVKELLTNTTNTVDTMETIPEVEEPVAVEEEAVEEPAAVEEEAVEEPAAVEEEAVEEPAAVEEELTVEKVKEEVNEVEDSVSLEIVEN